MAKALDRGTPTERADALAGDLVYLLVKRVGLSEEEVASMGKEEAVARLQRYWTEGR